MTTTFTYLNKEYQVDIDSLDWYNKTPDQIKVKLPNGTLLEVESWRESNPPQPKLIPVEFRILEATEVDKEELAFQRLLKEYKYNETPKLRTLWFRCLQNSALDIEKATIQFLNLVDLITKD